MPVQERSKDPMMALRLDDYVPPRGDFIPTGQCAPPKEGEATLPLLLQPVTIGPLQLKNRTVVSPMCMYSARNGMPNPWQLMHLGAFAMHGAGTIIMEATAVTPEGRITPSDLGLWSDEHTPAFASIVQTLKTVAPGVTIGIQLAHAGRKASTWTPFDRGQKTNANWVTAEEGGFPEDVIAPSAIPHAKDWITPKAMTEQQIKTIVQAFGEATRRAVEAGFDFVEVHSAHGYLAHEFYSPVANKRTDDYGGSFANRTRFLLECVQHVRQRLPASKGLWVRLSCSDWLGQEEEGGSWRSEDTCMLAPLLREAGVDLIDCSSGAISPRQSIPTAAFPGYQLPFAKAVKALQVQGLHVGAVGRLGDPHVAERALQEGACDVILNGRAYLATPHWTEEAGAALLPDAVPLSSAPQFWRAAVRTPGSGQTRGTR